MVLVGQSQQVPPRSYDDGNSVRRVEKRLLIGPNDGAPNFAMRRFTVDTDGHTPYHAHPWEHEVYILAGSAELRTADRRATLAPGDFAFVPAGAEHQFANIGHEVLEFLCMVPLDGEDG